MWSWDPGVSIEWVIMKTSCKPKVYTVSHITLDISIIHTSQTDSVCMDLCLNEARESPADLS